MEAVVERLALSVEARATEAAERAAGLEALVRAAGIYTSLQQCGCIYTPFLQGK